MNKHIIYIPNLGQEYILSQQLAHAFAKHHCEETSDEDPTIIAQYGSNLKPLELVSPKDTLQIMFTPISDLYAPMHTQTTTNDLLKQVPMLINHLLQDGLDPSGCTIQLYTLEFNGQNTDVLNEIARELCCNNNFKNFTIEWHVIPRLKNLSNEQLDKIFQPSITCQASVHAVGSNSDDIKLIESSGLYIRSENIH